ncbi:membrane progestin receptor epsilon [Nerophis lumbriciformis]|uniref:membrane progestin receptor epsilon n=1 Tax=Nerophis lumbriciformis TaxID=546530 RepID=UPI002ADFBE9E|nr:membrane progestin receptor epsilon [Nerophis lumbriciformis]
MLLNCERPLTLLSYSDVPPRVIENFILTGYRFPNYSFRDCVLSAFRPTNETGNFWTHFLPVFVFAYHFAEVFDWEEAPSGWHPFFYPLWTYFLCVSSLLVSSSFAHLLNSMSLVVREVCFFVDYGTISAYTVGSSLAYHYYIHPRPGLDQINADGNLKPSEFRLFFETLYIPSACVVAIICLLSCCYTRQKWRRYRYAIRTLVFLLPFLVSSTPIFYRLLVRSPYSTASVFFYRHCFWLLAAAGFNISKVPERLSPGHFDIWGHSHQWFHCCTFLSILDELHMIKSEVRAILAGSVALPPGPAAGATYGVMLFLQATIVSIIVAFSWHANCLYGNQLANKQQKCH